jgi:hypothetical protein
VVKRAHKNQICETTFSGVPTTLLTSTSSFRAIIEAGSLTKIQGGSLRFNLTNSGTNSRLVAPIWWFDQIVVFEQGGSKELITIYGINLFHNLQNMGKGCRRAASINETWCSEDLLLATSKTKDLYLPIASHFLSEIYIEELKGDIVLLLHPHGSVLASGTGTIVVDSMIFITNTVSLTEQDALVHRSLHKTRILSTYYLEPTRISTNNVTLTRGQEYKQSLENLNGAYAYILCGIRATGSTSANDGHSQFVSLGPRGSIDIKSSDNSSLLGSETSVPEKFLRTVLAQRHYPHSDRDSCNALYMIPWT